MVTYAQWSPGRRLLPVTWACGGEEVLAREVAAEYRRAFAALPVVVTDAVTCQPGEAWDEVLSRPPGGKLSLVCNAERLVPSPLFAVVVAEASPSWPVLFITPDPAFARKDGAHLEVLAASRQAQVIRCVAPASEEGLAEVVAAWWPGMGRNHAARLLEACGGSLELAREAAEKGIRCQADPATAPLFARKEANAGWADLLVAGDRRGAAVAAREVEGTQVLAALRLLGSRLSLLSLLEAAAREGLGAREQASRVKASPYAVRFLRPHARDYPPSREARCREVLAAAEQAAAAGARDGVLEAVALLW
jgi:hypothetical protein